MPGRTTSVVVAVGAVAAVAVAGWRLSTTFGSSRDVRTAEEASPPPRPSPEALESAEAPGGNRRAFRTETNARSAPAWIDRQRDGVFQASPELWSEPGSPDAFEELADEVIAVNEGLPWADEPIKGLDGAGRRALAQAWRAFTTPLVAEDRAAFLAAIDRLGFTGDADGAGDQLYRSMAALAGGARIAVPEARVRSVDPEHPGDLPRPPELPPGMGPRGGNGDGVGRLMMMRMSIEMQYPDDPTRARKIGGTMAALADHFEGAKAALDRGRPIVEVWMPIRLAQSREPEGHADAALATYWALVGSSRWVPVGVRLETHNDAAQDWSGRLSGES